MSICIQITQKKLQDANNTLPSKFLPILQMSMLQNFPQFPHYHSYDQKHRHQSHRPLVQARHTGGQL